MFRVVSWDALYVLFQMWLLRIKWMSLKISAIVENLVFKGPFVILHMA